jgi:hypothetical protein
MTEEEENGVVEAEDKSEPEDLNELEEEIIQVTSSEAREDSGKSGSRYCSHSEIHQAREDCRFVSGQSIRSSVSSMQSSTLQPKYGAGEDVRSKETEEANSSAPITSYKPPEDSGKSGSRHCSHSENNQTKKSHRVVSDDSVSPSKSQTEPIAEETEYDDLLDELELLLEVPEDEVDWDALDELIETIEAEEDERVKKNCADDLSGSSFSTLTPTKDIEAEEDVWVEDYAPNLSGSSLSSPSPPHQKSNPTKPTQPIPLYRRRPGKLTTLTHSIFFSISPPKRLIGRD